MGGVAGLISTIIDDLLKKRDELSEELEKIDKMLIAAGVEPNKTKSPIENKYGPKSGTPWTHHIRKIIISENKHMTRQDLEKELVRRGVADQDTVDGAYNTIIGILARLMKNEELTRDEDTGVLMPGRKYTEKDDNSLLASNKE